MFYLCIDICFSMWCVSNFTSFLKTNTQQLHRERSWKGYNFRRSLICFLLNSYKPQKKKRLGCFFNKIDSGSKSKNNFLSNVSIERIKIKKTQYWFLGNLFLNFWDVVLISYHMYKIGLQQKKSRACTFPLDASTKYFHLRRYL